MTLPADGAVLIPAQEFQPGGNALMLAQAGPPAPPVGLPGRPP